MEKSHKEEIKKIFTSLNTERQMANELSYTEKLRSGTH